MYFYRLGAALNSRCMFRCNFDATDNLRLYSEQLRWANGSGSDLIALLHAYQTWLHLHNQGVFGEKRTRTERENMKRDERKWAKKFCLDIDALYECHVQVNEIKMRLERMNIKSGIGSNYVQWNENEKVIILKVVIAGGFYPNYFARNSLDIDDYANKAFHCIGTRDPRNTVYFTSFDREHVRCLYTKSVKKIFIDNQIVPDEKHIQVNFEHGSNKTFVTFRNGGDDHIYENGNELMPGKLATEVYKAIKMRELRIHTQIWTMKSPTDEVQYVRDNGIPITSDGKFLTAPNGVDINTFTKNMCLPRLLDVKMTGFITHVCQYMKIV